MVIKMNEIEETLNMGFIGPPMMLYMDSLPNINEAVIDIE